MIRPFTCVCMILAAGSGLYVYQTKHRGQMLDKEVARTLKATDAVRARITVLTSEWSALNEGDRLAELARQHLALRNTATAQFAALNDLGGRLPAPLPPGTGYAPTDEGDDIPATVTLQPLAPVPASARGTATAAPARATAAVPAPAGPTPVQVAALPTPPASHPAAKPATRPSAGRALPEPPSVAAVPDRIVVAQAVPRQPAAAAPAQAALPVPAPAAPPRPRIMAPVIAVAAAPIAAPTRVPPDTADVRARSSTAALSAAVPAVSASGLGSVLGGPRSSLPAPVPYVAQASR